MWFYALSGLINGVTLSILGILVFLKGRHALINRTYAVFCFFISFWSYSYFLWQISTSSINALHWCRMLMFGAIFIPASYFHFILAFLGKIPSKINRCLLVIAYLLAIIFAILNFSPLMTADVRPRLKFPFWPTAGPSYIYFLMYFTAYASYGCYLLLREVWKTTGPKRNQYIYIFVGSIIGYLGGATNFPLWYDIYLYPVGNILSSVYVGLIAYAILRYRLMDIKLAVTRTGIFVVVYALVLGIPLGLTGWGRDWLRMQFGDNWYWASVVLAIIFATLGPFIYLYIDRRAEDGLLKEQKRYQQTLRQASMGMTRVRDLRRLLDLIAHVVTKTVKITYVGIYLFNEEANEYVLQVYRDKGRTPVDKISADNPLISWLTRHRQALVHDELKRQMDDMKNEVYAPIIATLQILTGSVVVPSLLEDKLLAFFVLGEKASGHIYTTEDLGVFQILASQAALAIENARFFEETKQMQEQIAQAEKMATVGTMADGLSHQINNRFYALLLIAGNTIDTIKTTDTSKCSPEMQAMFNEVNHALERIKENVVQGGEVVKGLLKYTRKSDEGFEELTLDKILDDALSMAQYKIKLPEFDIIRDYPKELPRIRGNAVQLQEVFFNFFDNAYDAIVERRTFLKEEGYRGRIVISAQANTKFVAVSFADNGMGIKHEALKKMFTPFFTTKTSARKGTGLGLYVIKRIVEDFHKGTIAFESTHHFGTTFTLQLPMAT